jgi:hypothetical protein
MSKWRFLPHGAVVGRILKVLQRRSEHHPWMWTLAFGHHEDRTPGIRRELAHIQSVSASAAAICDAKHCRRHKDLPCHSGAALS